MRRYPKSCHLNPRRFSSDVKLGSPLAEVLAPVAEEVAIEPDTPIWQIDRQADRLDVCSSTSDIPAPRHSMPTTHRTQRPHTHRDRCAARGSARSLPAPALFRYQKVPATGGSWLVLCSTDADDVSLRDVVQAMCAYGRHADYCGLGRGLKRRVARALRLGAQ